MTVSSISSISSARAALFDLLEADAPDALAQHAQRPHRKVQITFGPPGHEDLECVALLGVRSPVEDVESLGAMRREEEYGLEVGVKVHVPAATDDATGRKLVDARGFFVAEWVRSVVHGHYTLNGAVRTAFITEQTTVGVQPADKAGLVIFLLLLVSCEATIVGTGAAP